jgi:hypothetical protein
MKTNFYKVKCGLVPANWNDFKNFEGEFVADKQFIVADLNKNRFDWFYNSIKLEKLDQKSLEYYREELHFLLINQAIHKIIDCPDSVYYNMIIRTASEDDLFVGKNHLKVNATYYKLNKMLNVITGPFLIAENDTVESFRTKIEHQELFVFNKKQLFEKIIIKKAA